MNTFVLTKRIVQADKSELFDIVGVYTTLTKADEAFVAVYKETYNQLTDGGKAETEGYRTFCKVEFKNGYGFELELYSRYTDTTY